MKTLLFCCAWLANLALTAQPNASANPLADAGISFDLSAADYQLLSWADGVYTFAPNGYTDADSTPAFFILYYLEKKPGEGDSAMIRLHRESLNNALKQNPPSNGDPETKTISRINYRALETSAEVTAGSQSARFYQLTIDHHSGNLYLIVALAQRDPDTEMARIRRVLETMVFLPPGEPDPMAEAGFSLRLDEFGYRLAEFSRDGSIKGEVTFLFLPALSDPPAPNDSLASMILIEKMPNEYLDGENPFLDYHEQYREAFLKANNVVEVQPTRSLTFKGSQALETMIAGEINGLTLSTYGLSIEQPNCYFSIIAIAFPWSNIDQEMARMKALIWTLSFQ